MRNITMKTDKIITMKTYNEYVELLPRNGHLLIAGTTGSGKSVVINGLIPAIKGNGAIMTLLDPKKVELSPWTKTYNCACYADTPDEIINSLRTSVNFMMSRYDRMKKAGQRKSTESPLYIIIDELADLMLTNKKDILPLLQRLLQLGRAANIHIIAATQAPSRHVIPAELTLNFTHRLALRCISAIESRQIITIPGAERLPLHGTGILLSPEGIRYINLPYVSDDLINENIKAGTA